MTDRRSRDLGKFTGEGYDKGRSRLVQILWMWISGVVVARWWCPLRLRASLLRMFGASIGHGAVIKHDVRIHWPWKLSVGDHTWIGEGAYLLNIEPLTIGSNVCISQQALLCTGSHDRRSGTFEFDNAPIVVEDGVWVAARATVLRGVTVGADAVVGASALVTSDVAPGAIVLAAAARVAGSEAG